MSLFLPTLYIRKGTTDIRISRFYDSLNPSDNKIIHISLRVSLQTILLDRCTYIHIVITIIRVFVNINVLP